MAPLAQLLYLTVLQRGCEEVPQPCRRRLVTLLPLPTSIAAFRQREPCDASSLQVRPWFRHCTA
jgi:hypothetical protein